MLEYLYHYTTVETLALILENRTIRFSSLKNLDDAQEEFVSDSYDFGKFVYVSSWTADEKEKIPMWNMYSRMDCGVRIKLPKNPFKEYEYPKDHIIYEIGQKGKKIVDYNMLYNEKYHIENDGIDEILYEVKYIDSKEKLEPTIINDEHQNIRFCLDKLGRYKNTYWRFQDEWRYILRFIPIGYSEIEKNINIFGDIVIKRFKSYSDKMPAFYDLRIKDEFFENMEIVLSPKISQGNKVIVYSLRDKYNPKMIIKESELHNLIR